MSTIRAPYEIFGDLLCMRLWPTAGTHSHRLKIRTTAEF